MSQILEKFLDHYKMPEKTFRALMSYESTYYEQLKEKVAFDQLLDELKDKKQKTDKKGQ